MSPSRAPAWRPPARAAAPRAPRPAGSFGQAVLAARAEWDALTGGPGVSAGVTDAAWYSEQAAACILTVALALWSDVAALLGDDAAPS